MPSTDLARRSRPEESSRPVDRRDPSACEGDQFGAVKRVQVGVGRHDVDPPGSRVHVPGSRRVASTSTSGGQFARSRRSGPRKSPISLTQAPLARVLTRYEVHAPTPSTERSPCGVRPGQVVRSDAARSARLLRFCPDSSRTRHPRPAPDIDRHGLVHSQPERGAAASSVSRRSRKRRSAPSSVSCLARR